MTKFTERIEGMICPNCGNDIINRVTFQDKPKEINNKNYMDVLFPEIIDMYYVCVDCGIRFEKTDKNGNTKV